mgnify:CR=1 FL=1
MKTVIYYFTGTGNSLAAARKICGHLGDCELVSIASLATTSEEIHPTSDRVGIVCPVYYLGLPSIVTEFVNRLDLSRTGYCFAVLTMGGFGTSALHQLDDLHRVDGRILLEADVDQVRRRIDARSPASGSYGGARSTRRGRSSPGCVILPLSSMSSTRSWR